MAKGKKLQTDSDSMTRNVGLVLPMGDADQHGYVATQTGRLDLDLGHGGPATESLRALHAGLVETHARLASGRPVVTKADVVRWVFEQLATADEVELAV